MSNVNEQNLDTQIKPEIQCVINPLTKRRIQVGSKLYNQLMNKGILGLSPEDKGKVVYRGDSAEDAKKAQKKLQIEVGDKHMIKPRGNKVIIQRKQVNKKDLNDKIKKLAITTYLENRDKFRDDMNTEEINAILQQLINQALIDPNNTLKSKVKEDIDYILLNTQDNDEIDEEDEVSLGEESDEDTEDE